MHHRKLTSTASGTQKINCWCIILTENQPSLHHANRDLTISAWCCLKTDHHCIILTEYWPWPHYSDRIFSIVAWRQLKIDHCCIINAEIFVAEIFLFDRKYWKIETMTVWYWNIQRKLYEVEWQNLFGNWCIVRKLKQRWNHGELTTENWSSQHYTCRKFCCRNFSFWQKIFKNIDCYRMVLE